MTVANRHRLRHNEPALYPDCPEQQQKHFLRNHILILLSRPYFFKAARSGDGDPADTDRDREHAADIRTHSVWLRDFCAENASDFTRRKESMMTDSGTQTIPRVNHANVRSKTITMVQTALLVAVTLVMGTTPLGTIRTPFLSASIVTVPVAIAAMTVGWQASLICGTVFGITSFINAVNGTSGLLTTLFTVNPFGVFVTAVVARALMGLMDGLVFRALGALRTAKPVRFYLTALAAPLLNTLFFMASLVLFFYHSKPIMNLAAGLGAVSPIAFVVALVGVQGLIEASVGCLLAGSVGMGLARALRRSR